MGEFRESRKKGIEEWNIEVEILEEHVGDCHESDNHELEEAQVNNGVWVESTRTSPIQITPRKWKV